MIKINLGCGFLKKEGYINIDIEPKVKPDIVAPAHKLPFDDNSIDYIYARAIIEHIPRNLIDASFKELFRVLKPKCKLLVIVPHFTSSSAYQIDHTTYYSSYALDCYVRNPTIPSGKAKMFFPVNIFYRNKVSLVFGKNILFYHYLIEWFVNLNKWTLIFWEESFLKGLFPAKLLKYEMIK